MKQIERLRQYRDILCKTCRRRLMEHSLAMRPLRRIKDLDETVQYRAYLQAIHFEEERVRYQAWLEAHPFEPTYRRLPHE